MNKIKIDYNRIWTFDDDQKLIEYYESKIEIDNIMEKYNRIKLNGITNEEEIINQIYEYTIKKENKDINNWNIKNFDFMFKNKKIKVKYTKEKIDILPFLNNTFEIWNFYDNTIYEY
jgi:hypothetical protein